MSNHELSLFDFLPEEEAKKYKAMVSDDWKWSFSDYPKDKNGLKVFSCFACGGGSTMGYKLAGCDVIGCCEIDPRMNEIYIANHKPKYNFLMDIREFNQLPREEVPNDLFDIDILDGSPPCTTFSMAGQREKNWGKEKKFREGQKMQTLDDLSFIFIDTVKKLRPKVVVIENVEGLILGEAFEYVKKIYSKLDEAGYLTCHWLLKGEKMGVPQTRHRVFFVACRKDINFDPNKIDMTFNYEAVPYKAIKSGNNKPLKQDSLFYEIAKQANESDKNIADTRLRLGGKGSAFQTLYVRPDTIIPTIRAKADLIDINEIAFLSWETIRNAQTFPQDYNFIKFNASNVSYICGMSVPPIMMKRIVTRLIEQGVFKYKGVKNDE